MSGSNAPYRIWIAGANEWLPGPQFDSLDRALTSAHKLAATGEVAIELPSRHWHEFRETGEKFIGPSHVLARGSQTDLADRASAVIASKDDASQAYKLSLGRVKTIRRGTKPAPMARISSTYVATPHTIESNEHEASGPIVTPDGSQEVVPARERRESKRFQASDILKDPACAILTKRTSIIDISETGLQIAVPAGVRVNVAGNLVLVFSGQHGFFELATKACWARGTRAGVTISEAPGNLVGRMFLRKMIAKWRERQARRSKMPR